MIHAPGCIPQPVSSDIAPDCGSDVGTGDIGGEGGSGIGDNSGTTSRPLGALSTTRYIVAVEASVGVVISLLHKGKCSGFVCL